VATCIVVLSPVVNYHGLARRYLIPPRFLMRPLLNGGTLGGRRMRKSIELGDSESVIGIAVLTWLSIVAALVTLLSLSFAATFFFAIGLALPLGVLRRRFGRCRLIVSGDSFLWLPHGPFGPAKVFPIATVKSISELRIVDDGRSPSPSWWLVLCMTDGTELRLGRTSATTIHEIVADLNRTINARTMPSSPA
jgi:hypothetical protein